ncbi:MAG: DNA cytosine methyltransferase, partial [Promethearchaeota archaeon]
CQGFSSAGKGLNFSDPRSKLFFEFLRLKKTLNAKYFLLENVKMKKEWENIITNLMGVEPIRINSADFSAQNRIRLYWTNIPFNPFIKKDQSVIRDVIPTVLKNKYIIHPRRKVIVLPHKKSRKTVGYIGTPAQACKIYSIDEKGVTLCATGGGLGGKTGLYAIPLSLIEIYPKDAKIFTFYAYKSRECCVIAKPPPDMCEKLQTIPLDYTAGLSDNQRYLLIGNGWTIKVIEHLLKSLKKEFNRSLMK